MAQYTLQLLVKFDDRKSLSPVLDACRHYIQKDKNAELFSGEHCSRILPAAQKEMSSVYLMSFTPGYDQQTHYHTGTRILLIFAKEKAVAWLGKDVKNLKEEKLRDSAVYVLRMKKGTVHKFGGDFVAISVHPRDTIAGSNMEAETTFL